MIENVYHVGGKYGETLKYEFQDVKFVSLGEFAVIAA